MNTMTEVMKIIKGKLNKNFLSEKLDAAMEAPEAQAFIRAQGSAMDSIPARLVRLDASRPDDDMSIAIAELCTFLDISHTTFMTTYAERFDTFGKSLFFAHDPSIRDLIARKIRSDIKGLRRENAEEAARALGEMKDILWEIFRYLTHGLSDPATADGECRVSLIIAMNPVQVGPYNLREELGMPEFNQMSASERDAVLAQYSQQLLKDHSEQIIWTLEALQQEKRYPAAIYNIKVVEEYLLTLTNPTQGGTQNVPGPVSSESTPII